MPTKRYPLIALLLITVIILAAGAALAQSNPDAFRFSSAKTVGFFATFVKTPFAMFTGIITFVCCLLSGFFEFWGWLFTGFDYKFPVTGQIWDIGWGAIVSQWWWGMGVTWHLVLSLFIWFGIFGGSSRKS
jgi:hypothetical protein